MALEAGVVINGEIFLRPIITLFFDKGQYHSILSSPLKAGRPQIDCDVGLDLGRLGY